MPTRRLLKSVLHNFLGTYTSRYSDYQGYWLFGFLVDKPDKLEFNLMGLVSKSSDPAVNTAENIALRAFKDQVEKAGLNMAMLREARLALAKRSGEVRELENGRRREGHNFDVQVIVISESGKEYRSETQIFVAPHDPRFEFKSAR
jgi:hypothetical protein